MLSFKAEPDGKGGVVCTLTDSVTGISVTHDGLVGLDVWVRANADLLIARMGADPSDYAFPKVEDK